MRLLPLRRRARTIRLRITPVDRDLWAVLRNLPLTTRTPPERRSFDRRPPIKDVRDFEGW